jgi:hypothetical protein
LNFPTKLFGYDLTLLPAWAVPAAIVHVAMVAALLIPTFWALARSRAGWWWTILLVLPGLNLLLMCIIFWGAVMPRARWSRGWAILWLAPALNIFFVWVFAFSPWERVRPRALSQEPAEPARAAPAPRASPPPSPPPAEPVTAAPAAPPRLDERGVAGFVEQTLKKAPPSALRIPTGPAEEPTMFAGPAKKRVWRLIGANELAQDASFDIAEDTLRAAEQGLLVGRTGRADIVVPDESISRNHGRFMLRQGLLHFEDLDSMNGTWVNGQKLEANRPTPLPPETAIEIGKMRFLVTLA